MVLGFLAVSLTSCAKEGNGGESFEFVMGTDYYEPPDIAMPQKGKSIKDPNFHTTIVRITEKSDGYSDPGIENEYAKADPENSDGTLLVLRGTNAEWYLYNASTYQMIKHLTVFNSCDQEPEPRWDSSDPKIFYYVCNTELKSYNTATDASTTIHDFKEDFSSAAYIRTGVEGDASLDRRYWCFMIQDSDFNLLAVIVYDKTSDSIVGKKIGFPGDLDYVSMDMSGNHCITGCDALPYAQVFSRDFNSVINLPNGTSGHGDLALTSDGRDVFVYQNVSTDWIAMADLNTGTETPLVEIPFNVNTDIGLHFSGNCSETPGWVLVSTYGSKNPPPGESHSWMDTQLFMVELKANSRIWRIAHTHSYTSLDYTGEKNYFAEAFATINTRGTKIYFGSNWRNFTLDYTDTYQVILPEGWLSTMP